MESATHRAQVQIEKNICELRSNLPSPSGPPFIFPLWNPWKWSWALRGKHTHTHNQNYTLITKSITQSMCLPYWSSLKFIIKRKNFSSNTNYNRYWWDKKGEIPMPRDFHLQLSISIPHWNSTGHLILKSSG